MSVTACDRLSVTACDRCLARSWLLARLSAHLELARGRIYSVLALDDEAMITAIGGREANAINAAYESFDAAAARSEASACSLQTICCCDERYPSGLRALDSAPAALYVAGGLGRFLELAATDPVALVGARRASPYGLEIAQALGRSVAAAGITIVSGMALGIDSAAHAGALDAGGRTIAVLPGGANRPYPPAKRHLYRRIVSAGAVVSELPPGASPRRWCFPARNRLIAALAQMTVVVEAGESSGALSTARFARSLGRQLGAVPGRVTSPTAVGANALLADGARLIRDALDVLDSLAEVGVRPQHPPASSSGRPALSAELQQLLEKIAAGHDPSSAAGESGLSPQEGLAALASLELAGYLRREPGGAYTPTA